MYASPPAPLPAGGSAPFLPNSEDANVAVLIDLFERSIERGIELCESRPFVVESFDLSEIDELHAVLSHDAQRLSGVRGVVDARHLSDALRDGIAVVPSWTSSIRAKRCR